MLEPTSTIRAVSRQVSTELDGEAVILGLDNGVYYGLNDVGTRVWQLVQQPRTVGELCDAIVAEFEVDPARCHADVLALLERMIREGLVEVLDAP